MKQDVPHEQELLHIEQQVNQIEKKVCYDEKPYDYWLEKNHYYHHRIKKFYRFVVPEGARVLALQCKNGYLLDAINPSYGVGIDTDAALIQQARQRYPRHTFVHGTIADFAASEPFDYILLSGMTMQVYCVQTLLASLKPLCHPRTRLVIDTYNHFWEPLLWLAQKLGVRRPTTFDNWLSCADIENLLRLTDYETVTRSRFMLLPVYIPFISTICNAIVRHIPLINRLCLHEAVIARPLFVERDPQAYTVSVIVPCRNEKGNIEAAIQRTATMGRFTELIFVEGNSHDGTLDEIYRMIQKYPERALSVYQQKGKGKADAVRLGFDHALGDILMILDADLTMPPEELHKFYYALVHNKGEFINGSRMVYGMEDGAMRALNFLANFFFGRLFSWLLDQSVKDTLCGTKVLWKEDYRAIARNRSFFGNFDPFGDFDLLFGAAKQNLKIIDMPVHYKNRTYGHTQIRRFYCGWILLGMALLALKKFKIY
jgi:SAM-dependent methyltransferase